MGEPVPLPDPMLWILAGMETYDSAIEMDEIFRTFDVPLTRLETFVREQVAPQPARPTRLRDAALANFGESLFHALGCIRTGRRAYALLPPGYGLLNEELGPVLASNRS